MNNSIKVVGVEQRKGTFVPLSGGDSIEYDNIIFHILQKRSDVIGSAVDTLKVKRSEIPDFFDGFVSLSDLERVVSQVFEPVYNMDFESGKFKMIGLNHIDLSKNNSEDDE